LEQPPGPVQVACSYASSDAVAFSGKSGSDAYIVKLTQMTTQLRHKAIFGLP